MPLHVHPVLRSLEEVEEAAGLILPIDSVGVTVQKAAETAGTATKVVPVTYKRVVLGKEYTVNQSGPPTIKPAN